MSEHRLVSLDAFRGFTILAMLVVNNAGFDPAVPTQLRHAPWGAFVTFCDLIFPWFLLIVGLSLPFARAAFVRRGGAEPAYWRKTIRRTVVLIALGILIDSGVNRRLTVGLDVLQLIGLASLGGALLYRLRPTARAVAVAALLVGYWAFIRFVPAPGVPAGTFEEGRSVVASVNGWLRPFHLAGVLSTIPATAMVLIGTLIADGLRRSDRSRGWKTRRLVGAGVGLTLAGLLWHLDLPMNKPLWTPPYILYGAGTGLLVLSGFYTILDRLGWRKWALVFVVPGMNALFLYVVSILVRVHTIDEWQTTLPDGRTGSVKLALLTGATERLGMVAGSWLFTTVYLAVWWLVLYALYRRRRFFTV